MGSDLGDDTLEDEEPEPANFFVADDCMDKFVGEVDDNDIDDLIQFKNVLADLQDD